MYVAVAIDPGSTIRAGELAELLLQYGFKKVQRGLWESVAVSEKVLNRLKVDLDRATDMSDKLRLFQFPVENALSITSLADKKWRRIVARSSEKKQD